MTVDPAYISAMSNGLYTVSDSGGTITNATFTLYLTQATAQVDDDLPSSVSSVLKDELIALMVCHRIVAADARLEFNSESIDGVSYSKQVGETSWSIQYSKKLQNMKNRGRSSTLLKATHSDTSTSLKFDDSQILS